MNKKKCGLLMVILMVLVGSSTAKIARADGPDTVCVQGFDNQWELNGTWVSQPGDGNYADGTFYIPQNYSGPLAVPILRFAGNIGGPSWVIVDMPPAPYPQVPTDNIFYYITNVDDPTDVTTSNDGWSIFPDGNGTDPEGTVVGGACALPPENGLQQSIDDASSTFANSMGFSLGEAGSFSIHNFTFLVLGTAMGFLIEILPYIMALALISAIVYFLYRAFRFFRH